MKKTGWWRTLWRTHSVVCRRCKVVKPNLSGERTETQEAEIFAEQSLYGLLFCFSEKKERGI